MSFIDITKNILEGGLATLIIFTLTVVFSLPLGLVFTFFRMSKNRILSGISTFFISVLRGTPLMLQLIVWCFGPYYLFGISLSTNWRFASIIIGFSINYAAYFAEIYRSGIQSIPIGQYEAAQVLGYTKAQTFKKIIFPQMCKIVIPPVTNEIITLIKDTSLAFAVSYVEMFVVARQIAGAKTTIVPLFVAGAFYYIFNCIVAYIMECIEKRFKYYW